MYLSVLLLVSIFNGDWLIPDTGVLKPLKNDEVIVTSTGKIYILNYDDVTIQSYDANGKRLCSMGFKGQGPGSLQFPWSIFHEGNTLYVHDRGTETISVFDAKCGFVRAIRLPKRGLSVYKVPGGWVHGDWIYAQNPKEPGHLVWSDDEFKTSFELLKVTEKGTASGLNVSVTDGQKVGELVLVGHTPSFAARGNFAYLLEANGFTLHIFDLKTKKKLKTVKRTEKAIPFDTKWAQKTLAELKESFAFEIKLVTQDYFPIVRSMALASNGNVYVDRWVGDPENKHLILSFDMKGLALKSTPSYAAIERAVGTYQDWVYVTCYDPSKETATLARCKQKDLEAFLLAHPIDYDGPTGRTFSRNSN